jgi:hypothetical protein
VKPRKVKVFVRCRVPECPEDSYTKGLCVNHYSAVWRETNRESIRSYASAYNKKRRLNPAHVDRERARLRKWHRVNTLGIKDATDEMPQVPCEICGREGLRLCCDHDHDTGLARGWLCVSCNRALGYLQDSPRLLAAALMYLGKSGKAWK